MNNDTMIARWSDRTRPFIKKKKHDFQRKGQFAMKTSRVQLALVETLTSCCIECC